MTSPQPVVVITGASSGIGRATAQAYARRGARLVLASRSRAALETVAQECRALGGEAMVVPTDVSHEGELRALAAAAVAEYGRIDVWVGNAGVFSYGAFEQIPSRTFRQIIETNLMGQISGARAVLPYFRRQGNGALVLVASLYSRVSSPLIAPYVTSKWGLLGFAEVLRAELRGSGIRVRVILPSTIDTPIYQNSANITGRQVHALPPAVSPGHVARAIMRAPHRRRFATSVGQVQRSVIVLHRSSPRVWDAVTRFAKDKLELRGGSARLSDGTVFEPRPEAQPVTGGWRAPGLRLAVLTLIAAAAGLVVAGRRTETR
ncbi:SDR family NAD(P)-dependent oxidoreductase [Microbacterium sp. CFBP9034]|uniref:SDR family NAD(P)-dependent oxidoreductase n=1 Tax=Microbacterium sp. CFBP9034 TaxID=3096540 RepID=UPI002A6B4E32|nr:SDR family NAD(P)-dependent oxidoreductase [Microbacterium sp. CFBP9034]MDY0909393.1 SDR family NAD(P)-dependent oxidoreductase [Microbacterium sp. CFBP9034]